MALIRSADLILYNLILREYHISTNRAPGGL